MAHVEKPPALVSEHHEGAVEADPTHKAIGTTGADIRASSPKSTEERALVRKMDMLILPLLSGSILFAYLVSMAVPFNILIIATH